MAGRAHRAEGMPVLINAGRLATTPEIGAVTTA